MGRSRETLILQGDNGCSFRMPAAWTELRQPDEYVQLSAGRCRFRVGDLLELSELLSRLLQQVQQ